MEPILDKWVRELARDKSFKWLMGFLGTNLVGLLLFYIFVDSINQQIKAEQRDPDFGDSMNFIFTAVPVFLFCLAVGLLWGVKALSDIFRHRKYRATIALAAVVAAWTALICFIRHSN